MMHFYYRLQFACAAAAEAAATVCTFHVVSGDVAISCLTGHLSQSIIDGRARARAYAQIIMPCFINETAFLGPVHKTSSCLYVCVCA